MKSFLLKVKHFFKRNIYPISVTLCTALVLGIIAVSAVSSLNSNSDVVDTNTPVISDTNNADDNADDTGNNPTTPTGSENTIIFDLPFENAKVTKEYAVNKLVYDKTTKYWITHEALDFACAEGQTVKAVYDGKITKITSSMADGTVVYLKVSDNLVVVFKGLSAGSVKLKEGDEVKKGTVIGSVTSFLSEKSEGIHLHLEVLKNDKLVDPTEYFSFNK